MESPQRDAFRKMPPPTNEKEQKIKEALDWTRGSILDSLDILIGDTEFWPSARRSILRAFGDCGLESKLRKIANE